MINAMPLMIIPFILYNLAMVGLMGSGGIPALQHDVMVLSMISGAIWSMALGDLFIVVALVVLFFEILKATRTGPGNLMNHMLIQTTMDGEEGRQAFNEKRKPNFTGTLRKRGEPWPERSEADERRLDDAYRSGEY